MGKLSTLAEWLKRKPEESAEIHRQANRVSKHTLFYTALAVCCMILVPTFVSLIIAWTSARPVANIPLDSWHRLQSYNRSPYCDGENPTVECVANPQNPSLWKSRQIRTGKRNRTGATSNDRFYWIGTQIPADTLQTAFNLEANQLVLGWINARYRLWIDGKWAAAGEWNENEPVILTIPIKRLQKREELSVAIEIDNEVGSANPDTLNYEFGQHIGEGFYQRSGAHAYKTMMNFANSTRPFSFFLANLILAAIFFSIWNTSRQREEYFYLSCFAFVEAIFSLTHTDLIYLSINPVSVTTLNASFVFYEGCFGALLGLSYARSRRLLLRWSLVPLLAFPWLSFLLGGQTIESAAYRLGIIFNNWTNPIFYAIGGIACLAQALYLYESKGKEMSVRNRRLFLFAGGLFLLATITTLQSYYWSTASFLVNMLGYRLGNFALTLFLGALALQDYRQERKFLENSPVSTYHRQPYLPEQVKGILLIVDLKGSERLFQAGAANGQAGALANLCLNSMIAAVGHHKGIVLQTEGDAVRAFFDEELAQNPLQHALATVNEMAVQLARQEERFREMGIFSVDNEPTLKIRGGLAYGAIKPIWQNVGKDRIPAWVETGGSNPFVESSRLMEIERQLSEETCSRVLASEQLLKTHLAEDNKNEHWISRHLIRSGKHGKSYLFAVYSPDAPRKQTQEVETEAETKVAA